MTRRYKPTTIAVGHEATQRAEFWREQERPDPAPEDAPAPAAWEAKPEPAPAKVPPHGKPPKGLQPPARAENSAAVRMFDEALRGTPDPQLKRRLRAAQRQMSAQIAREIENLPPGADPSAYGY